ncbi:DUF6527 family protein [Chenggangzhangella methanolivorans]|uniref:DUF6527 family protein n=1 Tax=Chenggangzhangella methanolivorans TaxID=1437009 RepID=UPI00361D557D
MFSTIKRLWSWLWRPAPAPPPAAPRYIRPFRNVETVDTQAAATIAVEKRDAIALVEGAKGLKSVAFRCPCGCGEIRRVNTSPSIAPCWGVKVSGGRVSLHPSVDLTSGCRAHFVLKDNMAIMLP